MTQTDLAFIMGFLVGYILFLIVYRKKLSGEKSKQTVHIEYRVDSKKAIEELTEIQNAIDQMKKNAGIL